VRFAYFRVQRFKGSEVQRFGGSKVQGSEVQRFKVQRFKGSRFRVRRFKVQGSKVLGSGFEGSGFGIQRWKIEIYYYCHSHGWVEVAFSDIQLHFKLLLPVRFSLEGEGRNPEP